MRGGVEFTFLAERYLVKLTAIFPLTEELAVLIEFLKPPVFAVRDVEVVVRTHRDRVHRIEFTRAGPFLSPLLDLLSGCIVFDDAPVAVAVGHEHVTVLRESDIRGTAKLSRQIGDFVNADIDLLLSFSRVLV